MSILSDPRVSAGDSADQPAAASPLQRLPQPAYEGDYVLEGDLSLESGGSLVRPTLRYAVYGRLNAARDNAVLVCHALSGSAQVGSWWPELFAPDGLLSLERDCVLCVNLLGSCYGSTGPGSLDPQTGEAYGPDFPLVSIRDNVRAQALLLKVLGIDRLRLVLGASIGGMQALEWAMIEPDRVQRAAIIAVAPLSAMGLALNHLQRQAIQQDPAWLGGRYLPRNQPRQGLALARQIAMLSYKAAPLFDERFGRNPNRNGEDPWASSSAHCGPSTGLTGERFDIAGYLDYQGRRFIERFDANAYLAILRMMDTWDPLRGHRSALEAFGHMGARLSFIGIRSDWLFPCENVRHFAGTIRSAGIEVEYREMSSDHGHDAFLAEQAELVRLLN